MATKTRAQRHVRVAIGSFQDGSGRALCSGRVVRKQVASCKPLRAQNKKGVVTPSRAERAALALRLPWRKKEDMHLRTMDHPEAHHFCDVSAEGNSKERGACKLLRADHVRMKTKTWIWRLGNGRDLRASTRSWYLHGTVVTPQARGLGISI